MTAVRLMISALVCALLAGCGAPLAASPTQVPASIHPTRPAPTVITSEAVTPDGARWYAFDEFDDMGGSSIYDQSQGLFREHNGEVTHFPVAGPIRVLRAAPDGSLYIGAACGVLRYRDGALETLLEADCSAPRAQLAGFFPIDIAIGDGGDVWVGSARSLGRWDGREWREYPIPAIRVALAPGGEVWARGWDGRAEGLCCITRLSGETVTSYDEADDIAMPPGVREHLMALR